MELELIEEVSSLKDINRNVFKLNMEIEELLSGFVQIPTIKYEDTFELLRDFGVEDGK